MRGNSESRKKSRRGAVLAAAVVILYVLPLVIAAVLGALDLIHLGEEPLALMILVLYGVTGAAVIAGVLLAARQRLRETLRRKSFVTARDERRAAEAFRAGETKRPGAQDAPGGGGAVENRMGYEGRLPDVPGRASKCSTTRQRTPASSVRRA